MITVLYTKLDEEARVPRNAYGNDAGWDLFALNDTFVEVGTFMDVRTGIAVAIPDGYYGRIIHRSSAPRKRGLITFEGIIDAGFRGELFACVWAFPQWINRTHQLRRWPTPENQDAAGVQVKQGDSIAQLIIQEARPVNFIEVTMLPESLRGERGFGSSDHR
jgi:dUTP pyrophosphatase